MQLEILTDISSEIPAERLLVASSSSFPDIT